MKQTTVHCKVIAAWLEFSSREWSYNCEDLKTIKPNPSCTTFEEVLKQLSVFLHTFNRCFYKSNGKTEGP